MGHQPMSRRALLTATAITAATAATAARNRPATAAPRLAGLPETYVVPGDRAFPTGHAYDPRTRHIYVGSAEDGTLFRGHLTVPTLRPWSPHGADGRAVTSGMTVDAAGRLLVGGADSGTLHVYDPADATLLALLHGVEGGFLNEIAAAPDGTSYATDSFRPMIYQLSRTGSSWRLERWLDVSTTPIDWVDGRHNLNGIICIDRHLLTVNSATGQLWRIDRATRQSHEVDLGGELLPNGDGLAFRDGHLYVVQGNLHDSPRTHPAGHRHPALPRSGKRPSRGCARPARRVPPPQLDHPPR
ncbi:SMP-30/gluconolactonase/LRE family protein [Streptomyces phytophilus]|uniref:SMP-30/gluconolactonase/LRE family protein n=1 Tax=Streptomyces phytophilus TaxID=722715 RepID=UPI0015EFF4DC|nr:PQQ-like beta-propeller repeat protein [Streptomyces phytophilus]